jgi:DNA-binding transcriptional ArsR family regulator
MRESCPELCKHLAHEEKQLRSEVCRTILNVELIQRSTEAKELMTESQAVKSHADALASGLIARVQAALHATHLMSVQLTTWLGTFTPALSVGGNAGVSAEVQDGIYSNMAQLVATCSDGLHRNLAFEKERATMHLRCLEEKGGTHDERMAVWARYEAALAENQLHELRKVRARAPATRARLGAARAALTRAHSCPFSFAVRVVRATDVPQPALRPLVRRAHAAEERRAPDHARGPEAAPHHHVLRRRTRLGRWPRRPDMRATERTTLGVRTVPLQLAREAHRLQLCCVRTAA